MLTPNKLFLKRLTEHGKFQWNVFRLVVDWIIAIYFIVPALLIAGFQYHSWWSTAPIWIKHIPYSIVVLVLYRIATMGTVRLFIEEADQLFLLQHSRWMPRLKQWGMTYSFLFHFIVSALILSLLAPLLLVHYLLTPSELVMLLLYLFVFRNLSAFLKHFLAIRYVGWRFWLGSIGLQLVMSAVFVSTLLYMKFELFLVSGEIIVLAYFTYLLMKLRLKLKGTFARDVEHEQTQRLKFIALLLKRNIEKKPKKPRLKPFFFSSSSMIFKQRTSANGLTELYLKSFVRSGIQLKLYLQFIAIGTALLAVPILPKTIKVILWLLLSAFFCNWLKAYWFEVVESPFVQMFSWKDTDLHSAAQKGIFYVMLPGYAILSLAVGLSSFSGPEGLLFPLLGSFIAYMMSNIVISLTYTFQKKRGS